MQDETTREGAAGNPGVFLPQLLRVVRWAIDSEWPVRLLKPVIGKFNPFLPEFRRDPYAAYHRLRADQPVYFSPVLRGWILTRYRDCAAILQDPRFSVNRTQSDVFRRLKLFDGMPSDLSQALTRNLLMLDAPDHTRLRRLVSKAFTPRMVERLRPRVEAIVDELLEGCAAEQEIDVVRELAYPLPVTVIAEMLGVPTADRERFKTWSDDLVSVLDPLQAENGLGPVERSYREFSAYFREVAAARRREPRDDLISAMVAVEDEGETLAEAELLSLCMLILGAGHETTTNLIGNAVLALAAHPEQRRRLQDDPSLMPAAVEELLRYDSPIQATDRVVTEDSEFQGKRLRKGQLVAMVIGAANRDPERFADPDRLDVGRADNDHLAFSRGVHFCLGAALARVEAEIAIGALLRRFPDLRVDPSQPLVWKRSMILRGVEAVRVRLR